jgi:hypothetical protein
MRPGLRPRATYANIVSTLALFVALGGGAYAATALPANSIGSAQLRRNAVVNAKIRNNAVTGAKILNNSVTGADIKESTLAKVPLAAAADAAGLAKATYKTATATAAASSAANVATATCDSGQHVIGGGVKLDPPTIGVINDSYPDQSGTAWTAHVGNGSSGSSAAPLNFTVYAVCTAVASTG